MNKLHVFFLCLLCAACHPAFPMQRTKKARTQQDLATTQAAQTPILDSLPTDLIRHIAEFLPTKDTINFMRTCKTAKNMLQARPHILATRIAGALTDKIDNPTEFIRQRARKNPTVRICGCTVPTQELIDIATVQQQQSIIEILMSKEVDPIQYVCLQAQGNPTVTIYNQKFDTTMLLEQLINRGASPIRVCQDLEIEPPLTIESFFHNNESGSGDYNEYPIMPSRKGLNPPATLLNILSPEKKLDYTGWHLIRAGSVKNYQELLQQLDSFHAENPQTGIYLFFDGFQSGLAPIEQGLVNSLAKYPITALFIDDVELPEGIGIFSALTQLRVLSIALGEVHGMDIENTNFFPEELCQLTELRALQIAISEDCGAPTLILPGALNNLKKLQYLGLSHFTFDASLEHLTQLPSLHILKLISNEFKQLPECLCNLENLQILYWGNPTDGYIPDDVDNEDETEPVTVIPAQIGALKRLRALKIFYPCCPFSLPHTIGRLNSLRHIDFSDCKLEALPQELCLLANLKILELKEVPWQANFLETINLLAQRKISVIGQEDEQKIFLLASKFRRHESILRAVAHNINHIESNDSSIADKTSHYATDIMQLKDVVTYAIDLLNPNLNQEGKQAILDHVQQLRTLFTILEDPNFIKATQEFEASSYLMQDE